MRSLLLVVLLFAFTTLSFAQQQAQDYDKVEVFAGYSMGTDISSEFEWVEHGFNASAVYNFHRFVGVKADVSGTYNSFEDSPFNTTRHSIYNVTAGIQIKDNRKSSRFKPFAHFLAGYARHADKSEGTCPTGSFRP